MTQYIQATPGSIAASMGYSSQSPQSRYPTGQLGLANGGIANLPYGGGTIAGGNIQGTPMGNRTGFGWFKKAKQRLKKLIPKEIAPAMMAAAPFMGPIAGPIMGGLGSYKTYGKINPLVMAGAFAPHLKTAGYGDWGGGKSIRGLLTGQGKTGSGQGILGNWGNRIDAKIFGRGAQPGVMSTTPWGDKSMTPGTKAIEGFFGTGGDKIGFEDVFKTLTTDKKGDRTLKNVTMILTASTDYADALQRAKDLGMGEGDLPFSNDDEYNRAKAALKGEIPTKPLIAHGGRVGRAFGTTPEEGDIGFEEEIIHSGDTSGMDDAGIETFQETVPFEHEGAQPPEDKGIMGAIESVLAAAGVLGVSPHIVFSIMKMKGIGIMDAIEFVKSKMGGEEVIEEQVTERDYPGGDFPDIDWGKMPDWKNRDKGFFKKPKVNPDAPQVGHHFDINPMRTMEFRDENQNKIEDREEGIYKDRDLIPWEFDKSRKWKRNIPPEILEMIKERLKDKEFATGGRVGFTEGSGSSYLNYVQAMNALGQQPMPIDIFQSLEGIMSVQEMIDMGSPKGGNAQGGLPNTRTGLQWGSDKGEGLGGEEVEADMRYEGGFMPYGEEPKADDVPARLSKDEFVFTDQAVAGAGDGDIDVGAERLYNVMKSLEQGGRLSEETQGETAQGIGTII